MKALALGLLVSSAIAVTAPAQAQDVWFGAGPGGVSVGLGAGPYYGGPYAYGGPYYGAGYYGGAYAYGGPYYGGGYYDGPYYGAAYTDAPYYGSAPAVTIETRTAYDSYAYEPAVTTRRVIRRAAPVVRERVVERSVGYDSYAYAPPVPTRGGVRRAPIVETRTATPARSGCWVSTENTKNLGYYGACATPSLDVDAGTLGQAEPNVRAIR